MASTALGDFARAEAAVHGVRRGLRLLSGLVAAIGLLITGLLYARFHFSLFSGSCGTGPTARVSIPLLGYLAVLDARQGNAIVTIGFNSSQGGAWLSLALVPVAAE